MAIHASIGGISFPIASAGETTLADFDAGRDIMLGLMAAAISYELADRWEDAIVGTPLADKRCDPVETQYPGEPDPDLMRQAGFKFPLLCCYRTGDETFETVGLETALCKQSLIVEYIFAPWSAGTERKIGDIFRAVAAIAQCVARDKGHTAYEMDDTHTTQHKLVLGIGDGCANFYSCVLEKATFGKASFSPDAPPYAACRLSFDVAEKYEDTGASIAHGYLGMSFTHDLGDETSAVDGFSECRTDFEDTED